MVNPVGNKQVTKEAWKNTRMETGVGPGRTPIKRVQSPVAIMKVVRARSGPRRSIMIPERKRTTTPKLRERPIRVLAQGRSIPNSLTKKRGITV